MKLKALTTGMFAIAAIAVAVMAGAGATTASFSDRVTSNGNTFKAGTLQLQMGSTACANPGNRTYGGVPGNPGVDGNSGCTVAGGATYSSSTAMKPGDTSSATYSIKNIGSLSGTLSVGTTSWSVTTAGKGTCTVSPSNFTISSTYNPTSVGATSTASVPVTGSVPTSSADGCQGTTFTASVPFRMNGASTTGFSDLLTSTGNTFTMTSLPAPLLNAALDTNPTKVDLTWTGSYGSFPGTTFTGVRYSAAGCTGASTALNGGSAISSGYVDAPASAGQYWYLVTAHFATNWVAVSNCATATTQTPVAPLSSIYVNGTTTNCAGSSCGNYLGAAPGSGSWNWGDHAKDVAYTWPSLVKYTAPAYSTWPANAFSITFGSTLTQSAGLNVVVWLSAAADCSTAATSTTTLFTGRTGNGTGGWSAGQANANTSFTGGTGYLCMSAAPQSNGNASGFEGLNSFLTGPFVVAQ